MPRRRDVLPVQPKLFPRLRPGPHEREVEREWIEVRPSTLPGAGLGVFARVDIVDPGFLAFYRGELINARQWRRLYRNNGLGVYALGLSHGRTVDGSNTEHANFTRYINDNGEEAANCAFVGNGEVHVTRPIRAGEELFISYGNAYWQAFVDGGHVAPPFFSPADDQK